MPLFTDADLHALSAPHVQRAWFAEVYFPSGVRQFHTGMGRVSMGGETWEGVSSPMDGSVVGLFGMEEPRFGRAVATDIVFSGASRTFLQSIWADKKDIEGAKCILYFAVIDAETGAVLIELKRVFPGRLTAPGIKFTGAAIRAVAMKVISIFEGRNFPASGFMWSGAGQRDRYPGDLGLDLITADIIEEFK